MQLRNVVRRIENRPLVKAIQIPPNRTRQIRLPDLPQTYVARLSRSHLDELRRDPEETPEWCQRQYSLPSGRILITRFRIRGCKRAAGFMPGTMCSLAKTLPALIGSLLDREATLKRGRFREETMTDIFTGALASFAGPELIIQYPVEAETGGDLDLCFWHVATGRALLLRLQAKRLNAAVDAKKAAKIVNRSYRELLHRPPSSTKFQFETLIEAPLPWVPLYMFYNHQSVVDDPYFASVGPRVSGVNLAFAADIARELNLKLSASKHKPRVIKHHKRLSHLRKHLFSLEEILCPCGFWEEEVPSPYLVSASLRRLWMIRRERDGGMEEEDMILQALLEWDKFPFERFGQHVLDGPAVRVVRTLERPMITFISGRTGDDRTPVIV
jgi:hypothetical protein